MVWFVSWRRVLVAATRFGRDIRGAAAVEFAIIAPVLVLSVLAMADLGFAIHERAEIDQALRNGAELAQRDAGEGAVAALLGEVDATGAGQAATTFAVTRFCACAETPATATDCFADCADDRPTSIYYRLIGTRPYAGLFLPARTLERSSVVQIR